MDDGLECGVTVVEAAVELKTLSEPNWLRLLSREAMLLLSREAMLQVITTFILGFFFGG